MWPRHDGKRTGLVQGKQQHPLGALKDEADGTPGMGMERPVQSLETRSVTPGQTALSSSSQSRASTDKRGRSPSRKRSRSPRRTRALARKPNEKLKNVPKGCRDRCNKPRANHAGNDFDSSNGKNRSKADFEQIVANCTRSAAKGKGKGKAKGKGKDRGKAPVLGPHLFVAHAPHTGA